MDLKFASSDVIFSWESDSLCSTELYLRVVGQSESFGNYSSIEGFSHVILVKNLSGANIYEFYVVSQSKEGVRTISETRRFTIGEGISFSERTYNFTIERDYDQQVTLSVVNLDNKLHDLLLMVNSTYSDLILGFLGNGSMDQIISLAPQGIFEVTLAIPQMPMMDFTMVILTCSWLNSVLSTENDNRKHDNICSVFI